MLMYTLSRSLFIALDLPDIRTACWPYVWHSNRLYMWYAVLIVSYLHELGNVLDGEGRCAVR